MDVRASKIHPSEATTGLSEFAPVALFVFNRPHHTFRTLEALQKNDLADQTHLYIFCDGPRVDRDDVRQVDEVREIVVSKKWCGRVSTIFQEQNLGLADSIRSGIDRVLFEYDRIIVLEDDIVTSPGFLRYMNDALSMYAEDDRVMNISGFLPETNFRWILPPTFFHYMMSCWGWATWRRAWRQADWDANSVLDRLSTFPGGLYRFDMDGTYPYSEHLQRNREGTLKTWAVFWAASSYLSQGLCLYPKKSLVENIGLDGSGTNCNAIGRYASAALAKEILVRSSRVEQSQMGHSYLKWSNLFGNNAPILMRAKALVIWLLSSVRRHSR